MIAATTTTSRAGRLLKPSVSASGENLVAHSYGGFVITNAATGNPNVKALVYIDSFMPDQGEILGALAASSASCVDQSALDAVPSDGGVDLYLRWAADGSLPGLHELLRQRGRAEEGRRPLRRSAACGRRGVLRALRASGVEGDPVLVTHRYVGPRDPARAAGADVQPCRRAHHQGQGCRRHQGDPLRGRPDDVNAKPR
jgi:pimeloyl-ACP methyl ester carboxylesterase